MGLTTAKVFMNGRSQAIRLPKEFRVNTSEVYITREKDRIILRPKLERFSSKKEMREFFDVIHCLDFELDRSNEPPKQRELFFG
ncbi:AbrB/MazE/SpoVT family DNA-binding domain-containing protein [Treponema primitia]|uniref:antitoxin n=1 Tax=Treponema primitia TaxID=88058 RepID=UPI00397F51C3